MLGNVFVGPSAPDEPTAKTKEEKKQKFALYFKLWSCFEFMWDITIRSFGRVQKRKRSVCKKSTATCGEPILSSTGKLLARFDETDKETQSFTLLSPRFAGNVPTVNPPSFAEEVYPQNFMFGQPKNHISELQFEKFPAPSTFQCWKTRFTTEVYSGTDWPSESTRWIWEVELPTSVDDLKTSRSFFGNRFPEFEMLDAKIASS